MSRVAIYHTHSGARIDRRVPLSLRLLTYLAFWVIAILAFQFFLQPAGATESELSAFRQRLSWPLYAPVMAVVGLAQAATWPGEPATWKVTVSAAFFGLVALLTLIRRSRTAFAVLMLVHGVSLIIAVTYFVRFSRLPSGG